MTGSICPSCDSVEGQGCFGYSSCFGRSIVSCWVNTSCTHLLWYLWLNSWLAPYVPCPCTHAPRFNLQNLAPESRPPLRSCPQLSRLNEPQSQCINHESSNTAGGLRALALETGGPGANPSSATQQLRDLGQAVQPLCASVSSPLKLKEP